MSSAKANNRGVVLEVYADKKYLVRLIDGREMKCYLAGKMDFHKIKVIAGDRVEVFIPPVGNIGRVLRRL